MVFLVLILKKAGSTPPGRDNLPVENRLTFGQHRRGELNGMRTILPPPSFGPGVILDIERVAMEGGSRRSRDKTVMYAWSR